MDVSTIVDRTNWLRSYTDKLEKSIQIGFVHNKQTVTVHIILFACEPKCFYWLVVHMRFSIFCVLCTVKADGQER